MLTRFRDQKRALERQAAREERQRLKRAANHAAIEKLYEGSTPVILAGSFTGLQYANTSYGSALLPKLLGSYEEPIHSWIEEVCNSKYYAAIFDVGCAEGYYACGLAMRLPATQVYAYDINKDATRLAKEIAQLNALNNIYFSDLFDIKDIYRRQDRYENGRIFLMMDIEGDEIKYLNSKNISFVEGVDILVELHDCFYPGITQIIVDALSNSHEISIVYDYPWRHFQQYSPTAKIERSELESLMDESRPAGMSWLFARSRSEG
ncbi:MAG: methyltransferase domain-containing protein [Pseudomonadota bacterium]